MLQLLMLLLTEQRSERFGRWKGRGSPVAVLVRWMVLGVVLAAWLRAGAVLLLR